MQDISKAVLLGIAASGLSQAERLAVLRLLSGSAVTVDDLVPLPWNRLAKAKAAVWGLMDAGHVVRDGARLLVLQDSFAVPDLEASPQMRLPEEPGLGTALAEVRRPVLDRTEGASVRVGTGAKPPDPPGAKSRVSIDECRSEPLRNRPTEPTEPTAEPCSALHRFNRLNESSVIAERNLSEITDEDRSTGKALSRQLTENELMDDLTSLLGRDEMARAGGHWRVDHVRKHPGLLQRLLVELRELIAIGWTFKTNRAAWLEVAVKRELERKDAKNGKNRASAQSVPNMDTLPVKGISFPPEN